MIDLEIKKGAVIEAYYNYNNDYDSIERGDTFTIVKVYEKECEYEIENTKTKSVWLFNGEMMNKIFVKQDENNPNNNGGSTDYYKLPTNAKDLQDLIELKEMNFAQGNIFKAIYRANENHHSTYERDLNKIIWFANRELERLRKLD